MLPQIVILVVYGCNVATLGGVIVYRVLLVLLINDLLAGCK